MHVDRSERNYIIFSVGLLIAFAAALAVGAMANGIQLPAPEQRVDPRTVADPGSPFAGEPEERIREIAPGEYEVFILASAWKYSPGSTNYAEPAITVPAGSSITFYVTSRDIQHGFKIPDTNISFMVLPGQVSKLTATFDEPGTYQILCNEFCGSAHHTMFGEIIVEE